jgi:tetratricopeptide (TPR) repeat protein
MKRILLTTLLFSLMVCVSSQGWAGGLEDAQAGEAAARSGKYDEAIRLYNKAIESGELSQTNLAIAYNNRAFAWYAKGDYDRSMSDCNKAIDINPRYTSAYNNRGRAWYAKGDYDRAIADCTKAIEIDPTYALAYNNRGFAWNQKGDYNRAIADHTKALEIDPKYATAYNNLAWLKATCPDERFRDGKQAVELAEKAVTLQDDANFLDTLAAAYAEAGRFQDAIKTQEQAITNLKQEGGTQFLPEYEEHLFSYKAGKPWREK